ncbi:hypothetical protein BCR39DRAFT_221401 [Naematelia encephala]|uniref:Uncharacterized protein n=1 Tax=Naematelia encephala TaxID=71784 RepID=A0A1Y2AZ00_9TREE|nr:hypothetical protein BCR39DRAFT_221401 [Naematelia encephala]
MVRYSTGGIPSILKGADNPMHLRHGQNDTRSDRTTEKRVRLDVDEIVDIAAENARRAHLYMGAKENLEYDAHSAYIRPGVDRQTIPGPHSPRRVSKSQVVKMRVASGPLLPAKSLRHLPERSIPARKCGSASLGPHGHNLQVSLNDVIAAAPEAATPSNPVLLRGNHRHEKEFADNVCLAKTRPSESKKSLLSTVSARQAVDLDRPLPPRPIVTNTPPFIKRKAVPRIPPQDSARISLSCSSPETKDDQSASHKLCVFSGLTTSANRPHPPSSRHGQQVSLLYIRTSCSLSLIFSQDAQHPDWLELWKD